MSLDSFLIAVRISIYAVDIIRAIKGMSPPWFGSWPPIFGLYAPTLKEHDRDINAAARPQR